MEYFKDSVLITAREQKNFVKGSVPNFNQQTTKFKLLYRASRDGWNVYDYHLRCDNKGPTVTLVKSKAGKVCGGYTSLNWTSIAYSSEQKDLTAYLFSVDHQMLYHNNGYQYTVLSRKDLGPWFGNH